MYVKEDLIIPNQYTFYDLIINKARGKSGPLFHFDVHEDVRLQHDARVEKDESHAGKVVERHWYSRCASKNAAVSAPLSHILRNLIFKSGPMQR